MTVSRGPLMDLLRDDPLDAKLLLSRVARLRRTEDCRPVDYRPVELLVIEDNPGDVRLITEALRDAGDRVSMNVVKDGEEAMSFLRAEGSYRWAPQPDLVLLDLNLPGMDGRDVLARLKEDETLRRIPVIVLTSSQAPGDVRKAYDLKAICYITKPAGLEQFMEVIKSIHYFWSTIVELPRS